MKTKLSWLNALFFVVAFVALGCSSSSDSGPSGTAGTSSSTAGSATGGSSGNGTAGNTTGGAATGGAATGGTAGNTNGGSTTGGSAGATAGGSAGAAGASGGASGDFVYFVAQASGAPTAALANGTISVSSTFGASGNAFKYVAPNYYGTVSNGFIAYPTPMTGDFSITAQVTVTAENKANNACGIGLGLTTGFNGTDSYGYVLMRNTSNVTNGYYVSAVGAVSAGAPSIPFTIGTPLQLTFSRTGTNLTYSASPVGGTATSNTVAASVFSNGVTAYGSGAVYPALSFNNVTATITGLVVKDGTGATVFDSATGTLVNFIPASLTLSAATTAVTKGASAVVTATALAQGGTVSTVTAVPADATVATATVVNGATNSTITLAGLKGGVTTVTVTNTSDTNPVTSIKTIVVSVNDYETTDPYGSLATRAYPAPGAATAYTDGELALTFDAPPTLNTGGSIQIYNSADGTLVDSVAFAGETQTYGTTVINVGSQLARVSGNTVYFAPHLGKLAYGSSYYVVIPTTSITGTLNAMAFNGLSNLSTVATWKFTTRAAPTLTATVTVDGSQTSTANFRTIQGALSAMTTALPGAGTSATITVAAGTYNELIHYTGTVAGQTISIVGPTGNARGDTCIVQFANGNGVNGSTQTRASFYISGTNLVLQNITLKNTGVRAVVSQAESLYFASGGGFTVAAHNSSFYSNQDTIQTSGRAWLYDCFIEGNVDFIWGTSDVTLVESSSLHFINDVGAAATYGLFVARTGATGATTVGKGYVLLNSTVAVDTLVTAYFGRDAGTGAFYDQAALINNTFTGTGTAAIGAGIWNVATLPLSLGDSSYVGWKSSGNTGLNLAALTTDTHTTTTIANQATEYDTRDHILNRVVTVAAGVPNGFQAAATTWDVSTLFN